ncbi:Endo-beta-1,4-glucanase D [Colletotrichum truncatum]|uniref:Endo-beta-1,4-glucanase D n=1 Tax=Colletotrichum truncatum TaxID=5467 RepID=A0ACC3Z2T8_COLTU|nr:Endo-beta-1,4-glucanase D [Colletotrichum truncatum]KAF6782717.1 Endo-beta-1,4-glucanase D [Colletotrichum truncatum]
MRFSYTAAALAVLTGQVAAHARVYGVWVDGKEVKGSGDKAGKDSYIRSPPSNSPVKDITKSDIVCNTAGATAKDEFATIAAGKDLVFEWYHDNRNDDIIDGSHKGPLVTYIAPYTEGDGSGAIWTKIGEEKYANGKWPVDVLKTTGKSQGVTIPSSLKEGKYLVRHEIIAHHESDTTYDVNPARGAQFYPSCIQIEVTGGGSDVPPQNFDFIGGYKYSDKGIHFNLYNDDATAYKAPGPEVWTGGAGSGSGSSPAPPTTTKAPAASSAAAAPTTLATQVSSAAPVVSSPAAAPSAPAAASSSAAAAPIATPTKTPGSTCKRRRAARKARRSAH